MCDDQGSFGPSEHFILENQSAVRNVIQLVKEKVNEKKRKAVGNTFFNLLDYIKFVWRLINEKYSSRAHFYTTKKLYYATLSNSLKI